MVLRDSPDSRPKALITYLVTEQIGFWILKGEAGDVGERLSCTEVLNKFWMRVTGTGICFQRSSLSSNAGERRLEWGSGYLLISAKVTKGPNLASLPKWRWEDKLP